MINLIRFMPTELLILFSLIAPISVADSLPSSAAELSKLGKQYELARGVKLDYKKAYRLYCRAAKKGDASANYHLGMLHYHGYGVTRDKPRAMGWFQRGAREGSHQAKLMLKLHSTMKATKDYACIRFSPHRAIVNSAKRKKVEKWVRKIAPQYSIDPELVMAVIRQESGFDTQARSAKNAQGLMQLIPSTAKRFGVKDTWDPIENIKGGSSYLRWLLRRFKGDVKRVLAAYNAGEDAVARYNGVPPYDETQNYVQRIMADYPNTVHPIPPAFRN